MRQQGRSAARLPPRGGGGHSCCHDFLINPLLSGGAIAGPSRRPAPPAAAFAAGFRGLARDAARRGTLGPCRVNLPQNKEDGLLDDDEGGSNPAALAPVVLFFLALCAGGVTYREEINTLLASFTSYLEVAGPGVAWAEFRYVAAPWQSSCLLGASTSLMTGLSLWA